VKTPAKTARKPAKPRRKPADARGNRTRRAPQTPEARAEQTLARLLAAPWQFFTPLRGA
jgi:hypothetical protein